MFHTLTDEIKKSNRFGKYEENEAFKSAKILTSSYFVRN